jgi:drug/metabolite transporter (DMT)-like permease
MNALLYAVVVVIWGTTWIAIFLQQGPVDVTVSVFWRFAIASILLLTLLQIMGRLRRLSPRDHLFCALQGCCVFCFNFWCFYTAAGYINTGLESVIFSMAVLYNAVNSYLFFGQRPQPRFWFAVTLGLTGMILLFWDRSAHQRRKRWTVARHRPVGVGHVWLFSGQHDQPAASAQTAGNHDH